MMLKPTENYAEVHTDDYEFQANIELDRFTNISVEMLSMPFIDYGVVINLGGIKYKVNFMQDSIKYGFDFFKVQIHYNRLVTHLKMGLHLILNEKMWDDDYWKSNKGWIIDTTRKGTGFEEDRDKRVLALNLTNFIWHIIHTNPDIFEGSSETNFVDAIKFCRKEEVKEVKKDEKKNKKEKKEDKNKKENKNKKDKK